MQGARYAMAKTLRRNARVLIDKDPALDPGLRVEGLNSRSPAKFRQVEFQASLNVTR